MTAVVLVHHDDYADWVFDSHHPTQGRRFIKARERLLELADEGGINVIEIASDLLSDRALFEVVHDPNCVAQVIAQGLWVSGREPLLLRQLTGSPQAHGGCNAHVCCWSPVGGNWVDRAH
jgi:hypothetical protein